MNGCNDSLDYACTLLNVCAILSKMKKHNSALTYAAKAIKILTNLQKKEQERQEAIAKQNDNEDQDSNNKKNVDINSNTNAKAKKKEKEMQSIKKHEAKDDEKSDSTMLCIAYYNMAAELEYLLRNQEALDMYKKGYELAKKSLQPNHPVIKNFKESYNDAKEKTMKKTQYHEERQQERMKQTVHYIKTHSGIAGKVDPMLLTHIKTNYTDSARKREMNSTILSQYNNASASRSKRTKCKHMETGSFYRKLYIKKCRHREKHF